MERVECVVVGAGVVGLAVARRLALAGREVLVLEGDGLIGNGTSSRNSEVIHAGIYYPKDSLKARLCLAGRAFLYRYLEERGIPHRRCGKLIVATGEAQDPDLDRIMAKAHANGAVEVERWTGDRARDLEPRLRCTSALWSPMTGIVDSHGLMLAYQGDAEDKGAAVAFNAPFQSARAEGGGFVVEVGGEAPMTLGCRVLVNVAGLHAPTLARRIDGLDPAHVPGEWYCKGSYYALAGRAPFSRLVYPVPEAAGLGVHLTLDLAGRARFGPDTEWVDSIDYTVDPARADSFYAEVRRYWPDLPDGALEPGYAGIRPKIAPPGAPAPDFRIDGPETHGLPGLVNLFGIESPGLTASAAIAETVALRLGLAPSADFERPPLAA
ncbi:MAG: NAD(P)/FAD-dependent oxidoreductase [Geminicoccaceae bacterium]|nr:NAD(P)/FAD-dependent oxidoreductase [Geminicoccaceae bacterium]